MLYKDQSFDGNRPYNLAMFIPSIVIQITVKIAMLLIEITKIVGDCQITHMCCTIKWNIFDIPSKKCYCTNTIKDLIEKINCFKQADLRKIKTKTLNE